MENNQNKVITDDVKDTWGFVPRPISEYVCDSCRTDRKAITRSMRLGNGWGFTRVVQGEWLCPEDWSQSWCGGLCHLIGTSADIRWYIVYSCDWYIKGSKNRQYNYTFILISRQILPESCLLLIFLNFKKNKPYCSFNCSSFWEYLWADAQ